MGYYSSGSADDLRKPPSGPAPGAVPRPTRPDPSLTERWLCGLPPRRRWRLFRRVK